MGDLACASCMTHHGIWQDESPRRFLRQHECGRFAHAQACTNGVDRSFMTKEREGMYERSPSCRFIGNEINISAKACGRHGRKRVWEGHTEGPPFPSS